MFFITSKIFAFLSKPIIWLFLLLISSLIFKNKRKKILYTTCLIFYLLSNNFIIDSCSKIWEIPSKPISTLKETYTYGIVLGGYSSYNNKTDHINFNKSGDRLISAIELYKLGKIKKIVISGGNGYLTHNITHNNMKESLWSKNFLLNMGVKEKDILIEKSSRNTMENAKYTAKILGKEISKKSLLITSASHIRRANFCFEKHNFKIECYPTDATNPDINLSFDYLFLPAGDAIQKWEELFHEWIGYIVYRIIF